MDTIKHMHGTRTHKYTATNQGAEAPHSFRAALCKTALQASVQHRHLRYILHAWARPSKERGGGGGGGGQTCQSRAGVDSSATKGSGKGCVVFTSKVVSAADGASSSAAHSCAMSCRAILPCAGRLHG